jgi:phosphohistidine phosphatase SixA
MSVKQNWRCLVAAGLLMMAAGCAPMEAPREVAAPQPEAGARAGFVDVRALVIVRHADIDTAQKRTMGGALPLTKQGEQRAKDLAYALKDAGVTRIVTSGALRTKETAAALAKELGIAEEVASGHGAEKAGMPQASEAAVVLEYLARTGKKGDVILLVHHHSVIPSILRQLGYDEPAYDDATEFDRVYVVLPDAAAGKYRVMRWRYGK